MHVYVIGPRDSFRSSGLRASIAALDGHDLVSVDAVFFSEWPPEFSPRRSRAFNARVLSPGELGCAQAHMNAYRMIADGPDEWACVLEDDAVIADSAKFRELLEVIPSLPFSEAGTVVSLLTTRAAVVGNANLPNMWKCLSEPPLAVAYCLDKRAALSLLTSNADHSFSADWPRGSGVRFLLTQTVPVAHGDGSTPSIIGERSADQKAKGRLWKSAAIALRIARSTLTYLGVDFLVYRLEYKSFADYRTRVLAPRLWWRSMRFIGKPVDYPHGVVYDVSRLQRLRFGPWRTS